MKHLLHHVIGITAEHQTFILRENPVSSGHIEDDDPTKEKEAEMILEYIEKFNELFEDGKYEEAAIHAANSPKGILRTMETMSRFKCERHFLFAVYNISCVAKFRLGVLYLLLGVALWCYYNTLKSVLNCVSGVGANRDGRSPWLAFCDAIMSSVLALGVKPSDTMSLECVSCVLSENRLDLLSHWIAQDRSVYMPFLNICGAIILIFKYCALICGGAGCGKGM